jgi:hypothetical protein
MNNLKPETRPPEPQAPRLLVSEDWLAVAIAFLLIALAALGILGKDGIPIRF